MKHLLGFVLFFWFIVTSWLIPSLAWAKCRYPAHQVKWYVVQAGESCWSIAIKLFADGRKYDVIHRYNDLGTLPHILKPRMKLCFPATTPEPDATVLWKRKSVEARPPRTVDWRNVYEDMALWKLYHVRTHKNSLAGIRFRDRSNLALRELSRIVIYGQSAQRIRFQALAQRTIEVQEGTIRGGLASLDEAAGGTPTRSPGLLVKTPAGEIELRSKEAQIEYQTHQKTSVVSVYQGEANVRAKGQEVRVPQDFGTYVKQGNPPAQPKPLPPKPRWWNNKTKGVAVIIPGIAPTPFVVRWHKQPMAARYRVEWSRFANFSSIMQSITTTQTQVSIPIRAPESNRDKNYYVRVSCRNNIGMEGRFSSSFTLSVVQFRMPTPRKQEGNAFVFSGFLRIASLQPSSSSLEYSLGTTDQNFVPLRQSLVLFRPGHYTLRFRYPGPSTEAVIPIKILRVHGEFHTAQQPIDPKQPHRFLLRLWDEQKAPSAVPGLQITAYPGGNLPIEAVRGQRGTFAVTLPRDKIYSVKRIWLVASWLGGELTRTSIAVRQSLWQGNLVTPAQIKYPGKPGSVILSLKHNGQHTPEMPPGLELRSYPGGKLVWRLKSPGQIEAHFPTLSKPPGKHIWIVADWAQGELDRKKIPVDSRKTQGFVWPTVTPGLEWPLSGTGLPSRAAQPVSMVGLTSHLHKQPLPNDATGSEFVLRMAVRGELALWQNRLGLDLDLPWLLTSLTRDRNISNPLGDFRLGLKFVAWRSSSLILTPSLRFRFPTGGTHTNRYDMGWEPGLLLAWFPHPMLYIGSNQILVCNTDFSPSVSLLYSSSYALAIRPLPYLSLGLELNMAIRLLDFSPSAVSVGLGLGGSLRFLFDRFRLGLVAHGPLHPEGQQLLGGLTLGISMDIGFDGP